MGLLPKDEKTRSTIYVYKYLPGGKNRTTEMAASTQLFTPNSILYNVWRHPLLFMQNCFVERL